MKISVLRTAKTSGREAASIIVPKRISKNENYTFEDKKVTVIIPTYKPNNLTYRLVNDLITWYKNVNVIIVDDCTPVSAHAGQKILANLRILGSKNKKITMLQTPTNQLKASALNLGLAYIQALHTKPDVVITFDDDVAIQKDTVPNMLKTLYSDPKIGIVCSLAFVKNKKKNILTRLQGLEYHGFNVTKISDNGFFLGPLVMQGMLSAFRYGAIVKVKGFATDKLIEDYDITVRVKKNGYKTAIATDAFAWTHVPETLANLWMQRIRWSYGGLLVIKDSWRQTRSVFQDIIGHFVFLSTLILVLLSVLVTKHTSTSSILILGLVIIATLNFIVSFTFGLITMLSYRGRDRIDWLLKLSVFPEFVYSNILSAILIGSYLFFVFNVISALAVKYIPIFMHIQKRGTQSFKKLGYTGAWGTRVEYEGGNY